MVSKLLCVVCVAALPVAAVAAEFPKQGTTNYTTYYVLSGFRTMAIGEGRINSYELSGITRNDDGSDIFNNMGVRCLGGDETFGGITMSRGACTEMDKDGDQVFVTYEAKVGADGVLAGTHVYVGGTGKYAGITGKADYTRQRVKGPDNAVLAIVPHRASWTVK